jgi:quercetin dioxygenase-like cupin family protein
MSPVANDAEWLWFFGTLATIRITGEAVGGRFAMIEFLFPQHASPPLHSHPQDESYVVIEGELTLKIGDDRLSLRAGGAAVAPIRVPHTFRVDSETARVIVISTPAGLDQFVRAGSFPAAAATLPPPDAPRLTPEQAEQLFREHGQINLGPPLAPDE